MTFAHQLPKLPRAKFLELQATMLEAGIVAETGGDWREIFRRAKNRRVGMLRRIYDMLEHMSREDVAIMSDMLVKLGAE